MNGDVVKITKLKKRAYIGRILSVTVLSLLVSPLHAEESSFPADKIKAFSIDFNWGPGGPNLFAEAGHWSDASPEEHLKWYQDMGVNTIQTFCISCNGYAWYKNGKIPAQPGLKTDFLNELTTLGHKNNMRVMGYFCMSANTRWGQLFPSMSYGTPNRYHIPYTDAYVDFLCSSIKDALEHTKIDGFMIDWFFNPLRKSTDGKWLHCEKVLYEQLMGHAFPGEENLSEEQENEYGSKAIQRCWERVRDTAKAIKPDCTIWLSCHILEHPHFKNTTLFKEVDWLMNEAPDPERLDEVREKIGVNSTIVQCLCGWGPNHDASKVINDPRYNEVGFFGFAKPDFTSLPPVAEKATDERQKGNAKNIEIMRKAFLSGSDL